MVRADVVVVISEDSVTDAGGTEGTSSAELGCDASDPVDIAVVLTESPAVSVAIPYTVSDWDDESSVSGTEHPAKRRHRHRERKAIKQIRI